MANSLAVWAEDANNSGTNFLELHFNYWSFSARPQNTISGNRQIDYLDIGIRFFFDALPSQICVFLPFSVSVNDYDGGLGKSIFGNAPLLSAIFNSEVANTSDCTSGHYKDITFKDSKSNTETLRFHANIDIPQKEQPGLVSPIIDSKDNATIIKFPKEIFDISGTKNHHYFRFRIRLKKGHINSISKAFAPNDRIIMNKSETFEIVDFRVNEPRNLPAHISRKVIEDSTAISRIHFFLIRDILSEYKMSHSAYNRCRLLESNLWENYLFTESESPKLSPVSDMIIYHWRKEGEKNTEGGLTDIGHFSAFAKFSTTKFSILTLSLYLLIAICLGVLASMIASEIFSNQSSREIYWGFFGVMIFLPLIIYFLKSPCKKATEVLKSDRRRGG